MVGGERRSIDERSPHGVRPVCGYEELSRSLSGSGRIPSQMISFCEAALGRIDWSAKDARRFLGEYLSTPKPHVVFARSRAGIPLTRARLRLDAKTQLLYSGRWFFLNGESLRASARDARLLRALADQRTLAGRRLAGSPLATLVMQWHRSGYLHLERA